MCTTYVYVYIRLGFSLFSFPVKGVPKSPNLHTLQFLYAKRNTTLTMVFGHLFSQVTKQTMHVVKVYKEKKAIVLRLEKTIGLLAKAMRQRMVRCVRLASTVRLSVVRFCLRLRLRSILCFFYDGSLLWLFSRLLFLRLRVRSAVNFTFFFFLCTVTFVAMFTMTVTNRNVITDTVNLMAFFYVYDVLSTATVDVTCIVTVMLRVVLTVG